jgi:hypothetical protein
MTWLDAKRYFLTGDLVGFFNNKSSGDIPSEIFKGCIAYADGKDLDDMISKCLLLVRYPAQPSGQLPDGTWCPGVWEEADVAYRYRANQLASALDNTYQHFMQTGMLTEQYIVNANGCGHRFTPYHGLFEAYEFCTLCGKKRAEC